MIFEEVVWQMAPKAIHGPVDLMLNVGTILAGGALVVTSLVTTWGVWTEKDLGAPMSSYKHASGSHAYEFGQADPTMTSVLVIGCAAIGILAAALALLVDHRAAVLAGFGGVAVGGVLVYFWLTLQSANEELTKRDDMSLMFAWTEFSPSSGWYVAVSAAVVMTVLGVISAVRSLRRSGRSVAHA